MRSRRNVSRFDSRVHRPTIHRAAERVPAFLLQVPEGDVISYGELAADIGAPKAVRAAASACAANRIAILVPCPRVRRGAGGLGGYRWGLERKRVLIDRERAGRAQ